MKTKITLLITVMSVAFLMCGMTLWAAPLGTAFTYQGRLLDDNVAADGVYDIRFVLYDDPNTLIGNLIGQPVDANDVEVAEGYFIAELDFGGPAFGGDARWLQIAVRPYDSTDPGDYVALTPLQPITHTPYASYAKSSNWNNLANIPADFADGVDNNGGSDLDWTISGSDMYSAVSGNVGIGTSNPGASLDVTSPTGTGGAATIGSSSTTAAGAHAVAIGANADATNHYTIAMGTGATASGSYSTAIGTDIIVSGSRSVGIGVGMSSADVTASNVMAIMGGNVGIGTTIPDAKLDVIADAGTYYTVYAEHSDGNYGYLGSGGNGAAGLNSNGNSGTLGSSLYGVTGTHNLSGNDGYLGTSSEGVKGVSSSGYGVYGSGGSYGVWAQSFSSGTGLYSRGGPTGYAAEFRGNVRFFSEATNDLVLELGEGPGGTDGVISTDTGNLLLDPDGNVGIGTDSPDSPLHIAGSNWDITNTEGDFKIGDSSYRLKIGVATGGGGAGDVYMRSVGGSNKLKLGSGTSTVLTVSETGVGIGTTTPARKLHISDVMRLEPRATAPSSPSEGDIYYSSTLHSLMVYNGTTWVACF